MRRFRRAMEERGGGRLLTTDTEPWAPTRRVADRTFMVPPCVRGEDFADEVVRICAEEGVTAIVPLTSAAVEVLPRVRGQVEGLLVTGDDPAIAVCGDKLLTSRYLAERGVPTPAVVARPKEGDLPLFFRPRVSEGSRGACLVDTSERLAMAARDASGLLTRFIAGREYTVDAYKDLGRALVCMVARERVRVRAGEVESSVTCNEPELTEMVRLVLEGLQFVGPAAIQAIRGDGGFQVTEINLRFAGGVTLSMEAGMASPEWLLEELSGGVPPRLPEVRLGLRMSRYDEEFYFPK